MEQVYQLLANVPSDDFSPTWQQILEELGVAELLGESLKEELQSIFERNQITPATALNEVKEIHSSLQQIKTAIDSITTGFNYFKIGAEELEPGECEIGLLVPRKAVDNRLDEFGKELKELNFILGTFSELVTGEKENFEIKTLSSSDFLIYLNVGFMTAACLAYTIDKLVSAYKNLLDIREHQNQLKEKGVPNKVISGLKEYAKSLMQKEIEKLTKEIDKKYCTVKDNRRRNELKNAVRISLKKIAIRIDNGYNIEVRTEPLPEPEGDAKESNEQAQQRIQIKIIQDASKTMQFMRLEGEPLLSLPESEENEKPKKS